MTKARKIWLWILLVGSGVGIFVGFITMFLSVGSGIYAILIAAGQFASIYYLLFKERKEGFYGLCAVCAVDLIVTPIMSGALAFLGTFFGALIRLGGTCFFLSVGEDPILDIPFLRELNIGGSSYTDNRYTGSRGEHMYGYHYDGQTNAKRFCTNCGNKLGEGMRFCTRCGTPVGNAGTSWQSNATSQGGSGTVYCSDMSEGMLFRESQNVLGIIAVSAAVCAILVVVMFAMAAAIPGFYYARARRVLIASGVIFLIAAAVLVYVVIVQRKIYVCINENSIYGVGIRGFVTESFECPYAEIQEIYYLQGTITLHINGQGIRLPGLEDRHRAKMMIAEKLARL